MIVIIQSGVLKPPCLLLVQHAECQAGLQSFVAHTFHHLQHTLEVTSTRITPGCSHTEATGTRLPGRSGSIDHSLNVNETFRFQRSLMVDTLRAIRTVLRAPPRFDAQQGTGLDFIGIETVAMCPLGAVHEIVERQLKQAFDFSLLPVEAQRPVMRPRVTINNCLTHNSIPLAPVGQNPDSDINFKQLQ
jgi:hypothetical protein